MRDHAGHLRADIGREVRRRAARQQGGQRHGLRPHRDHADLGHDARGGPGGGFWSQPAAGSRSASIMPAQATRFAGVPGRLLVPCDMRSSRPRLLQPMAGAGLAGPLKGCPHGRAAACDAGTAPSRQATLASSPLGKSHVDQSGSWNPNDFGSQMAALGRKVPIIKLTNRAFSIRTVSSYKMLLASTVTLRWWTGIDSSLQS